MGPSKPKTTPELGQNKKSELNGVWKIKVAQLYELTLKQCLNITQTQIWPSGALKPKMSPKLGQNYSQNWGEYIKQNLFSYMKRPRNSVWTILTQTQKNSPLVAQKSQKGPKIRSKIKVKIEGSIENKNYSAIWNGPKAVFESYSNPKKYIQNIYTNTITNAKT